jgi:hypothetical protein
MTRYRLALAGLLALALTTPVRAGFTVTLTENGPNVVASGSGTLNLAALIPGGPTNLVGHLPRPWP